MWQITSDIIDDGKNIGTTSCKFDEDKAVLLNRRFRLLDDDGEVYYEGVSDDSDSELAFAPLDDFGRGFAGCTEIQYLDKGCWRRL